ncbi:sucrose transport protein [Metarhizium album ARSEF 1941]|uniref:Sucrose transport protein n=1 Tax=Metarhizium album (strain ARSEF 1941) TaxID=1081103 RepID=A0A0B2X368_METAS|nr:sucrose transport protein [Metarhizium album ARSEF 1941]KHN99859.1 sucrose transport protein [Metarhizium album ARSEF 1941]
MAMAGLLGQPSIKGRSEAMRMVLLNFCTVGITFTWGIEMTCKCGAARRRPEVSSCPCPCPDPDRLFPPRLVVDCTPYLLNLGLTKSNTSLIWIAGPLSGLLVQPVIGVVSDEYTSRWGRRRPFMVAGALVVSVCLLVLGFTKEIVGFLLPDEELARGPTIALAVLSLYVLDFAINAVMSCSRSLVVDTLPLEKQQAGAAWASRMSAVGQVVGYGAGAFDLVQILGTTLGRSQFQQLTLIAAAALLVTTATTCWAVQESVLVSGNDPISKPQRSLGVLRQIYHTGRHLPPRIEAICWAQFWSWIGWFPFLFYSTTWVGETYFRYDVPAGARHSEDVLGEMGRIGSKPLVMYSFITCTGAFVLPLFVRAPDEDVYTARPPRAVARLLKRFEDVKPDLLSTWVFGQVMFAAAMSLAPFATSFRFATTLVCLCGIPWTIAMWAPTALLGIEVNKLSGRPSYRHLANDPDMELRALDQGDAPPTLLGNGTETPSSSSGELSGMYFGIFNIYTTIPQFLGTLMATVVFAILEPGKSRELGGQDPAPSKDGPNAIAACLFVGALCSVVASFATRRLRKL